MMAHSSSIESRLAAWQRELETDECGLAIHAPKIIAELKAELASRKQDQPNG